MKSKLVITLGIIITVSVAILIMLLSISKPTTFEVKDGDIIIGGSFGVTVPVSGITGLKLIEDPPKIVTRTNGSGVGTVYKGEFTLEGNVKARLYADASKPPFITFSFEDTVFYINSATDEELQALYQILSDAHN